MNGLATDHAPPQTSQTPRFVFVVNPALSESVVAGVERFYAAHGRLFDLSLACVTDVEEGRLPAAEFTRLLRGADLVFLDLRGGGLATSLAHAALDESNQPVLVLVGGSLELMSLLRLRRFTFRGLAERSRERSRGKKSAAPSPRGETVNVQRARQLAWLIEQGTRWIPVGRLRDARNWTRAMRYWHHGGPENVKQLLAFIGREYAGLRVPRAAAPREYPDFGIYDPLAERYHHRLADYQRSVGWRHDRPAIGLHFYGGMHFAQSLVPARALARELRNRGEVNVLPVFASPETNLRAVRRFYQPGGRPVVDAIITLQWFQLTMFTGEDPDRSLQLLKSLNVPILNGAPMYSRDVATWREAVEGLSPVETMTAVIFPELDGITEPVPSCGLEPAESPAIGALLRRVVPIEPSIQRIAGRAAGWARLRRRRNADKRVALVLYNYPPGEDNLAGAAYLDVFESVRRLLLVLRERGYTVGDIPEPGELPERFLRHGLVNQPKWSGLEGALRVAPTVDVGRYRRWLESLGDHGDLIAAWGEPPGSIMTCGDRFVLPALEFGNVLLALQPARGYHADPAKISHDKTLPPHHQYVAFYRWLEECWRPDAVVHVGTHGTLEFLAGKEVGCSDRCWPVRLIGATPHLYLYHVVNASEAIIAKRRALGTLINYNSPAFTSSGLYDEYAQLEDLLAEETEARLLDPRRAERLRGAILERAAELSLPCDSLETLHEEVALLKRSIIPRGLHTFGAGVADDSQLDFATFLLRYDREETPSLHRCLAESRGHDYDLLLKQPWQPGPDGQAVDVLAGIEAEVRELAAAALFDGRWPANPAIRRGLEFAARAVERLDGSLEIENLLNGLDGGYVEPGPGGDPLRHPEVLPTGRNSFQFDPRLVPSDEAVKRGAEIAENTLRIYRDQHGCWPASVGVILWGFETTKTRGETVGQVLAYFGVRIAPGANPWFKQLEAIPLAQLGRPRIDCHVQICGFFRDMYANVVSLLNRAAALAAAQDEPEAENYVRRHTRAAEQREGGGSDLRTAALARARVFGPRPGEYGTRTISLIETAAWQDEQQIADVFAASMNHVYADNLHGVRCEEFFAERLETVDVVSQIRDSHEYEIADLDHYYEFFGGLARTVESVRGRPPEMLISDTTRETIRTEHVREALNRGIRTRLLNPKWIDGMLAHDYHGAQEIAERVQYLIGFAATTHAVEDWVFSGVQERYFDDEIMFQRLVENNRFAAEEALKRLFEAQQRGYWKPDDAQLERLRRRYAQLEGAIEEGLQP